MLLAVSTVIYQAYVVLYFGVISSDYCCISQLVCTDLSLVYYKVSVASHHINQ